MDDDALDDIAEELYGGPPEEFIAARTAARDRVKGDKELAAAVAALPKPTTAAWVCNLLARRQPDEVAQLTELGELLRQAQTNLSGDQLRALGQQRNQVVAALARQARGLAHAEGHDVSSAVAEQVESTLRAAVVDPGAGEALTAGRLTTALTYSGLGPVDLSGAVATPVRSGGAAAVPEGKSAERKPPARTSPAKKAAAPGRDAEARRRREAEERRRQEVEQARRDAAEAAGVARDAAAAAETAEQQLTAARERRNQVQERAEQLQKELRRVEREATETATAAEEAERRRDAAVRRAETAASIRDRSAARVQELESAD